MSAAALELIGHEITEAYNELQAAEDELRNFVATFRRLRTRLGDLVTTPAQEPYKRDTMNELATQAELLETALHLLSEGPMTGGALVKELYAMLNASPLIASLGSDVVLERARNLAQAYLGRVVGEVQ